MPNNNITKAAGGHRLDGLGSCFLKPHCLKDPGSKEENEKYTESMYQISK